MAEKPRLDTTRLQRMAQAQAGVAPSRAIDYESRCLCSLRLEA